MSTIREFRQFLMRGNVIDLAVGIIIGIAFGTVINSLVKNIINPAIAWLFGKPDFSAFRWGPILIGNFINDVVSFLLVALAVFFFIVKPVNSLTALAIRQQAPAEPASRKCTECLSEIPIGAVRCAFCGQPQPA